MANPYKDGKGHYCSKARAVTKNGRKISRNTPSKSKPRAKAKPRKSGGGRKASPRRNPRAPGIGDAFVMLRDGGLAAVQVLAGKAGVRSLPQVLNLPKEGNVGLGVQIATALALGYVSTMFFSRGASAAIMAGGLSAPIETLIVAYDVPWFGEALAPTSTQAAVNNLSAGTGRYPRPVGTGVSRYPKPAVALAGYPSHGDFYDDPDAY